MARARRFEELLARHAGHREVLAKTIRQVLPVEWITTWVDEHEITRLGTLAILILPDLERPPRAGVERPGARVIGLVLVQTDRARVDVQIFEGELLSFTPSHAFAFEKAIEQAVRERDAFRAGACHQLRVFGRIEVGERLARAELRKPPARDGTRLDDPCRVDRELEDARDQLRVVASRRGREVSGELAHRALRVVKLER